MATMGIPLETKRQINIEEIVEQGNPINPSRETRRQFLQNLLPRLAGIALAVSWSSPNVNAQSQSSRMNTEATIMAESVSQKEEEESNRSMFDSAIPGVLFAAAEIPISKPLDEWGLLGVTTDEKITPPSYFMNCAFYPLVIEIPLRLVPSELAGPTKEVGIKWNWGIVSSLADGAAHTWDHNGGLGVFLLGTIGGMLTWREMRNGGYLNAVAFHSAHNATLITFMHIVTGGKYLRKK